VSQKQEQGETEGEGATYQEVAADGGSDQERFIHTEGTHEEIPHGVKHHVKDEDVAGP